MKTEPLCNMLAFISSLAAVGPHWPSLAAIGCCGPCCEPALAAVGLHWPSLAAVGLHWPLLAVVGLRWPLGLMVGALAFGVDGG